MRTIASLIAAVALVGTGAACKNDNDTQAGVAVKPIEAADNAAEKVRDNDLPAAEDTKDEVVEANKEIGEAQKDVGEARQELAEETAEARKEIGERFVKLRDEVRALSSANATFVANRDQVVANVKANIDMIEQRMARMSARAGTLVGDARQAAQEKLNDTQKLATEARSEAITLGQATAATWDKARDESLDSLERLNDKVNDVSEELFEK